MAKRMLAIAPRRPCSTSHPRNPDEDLFEDLRVNDDEQLDPAVAEALNDDEQLGPAVDPDGAVLLKREDIAETESRNDAAQILRAPPTSVILPCAAMSARILDLPMDIRRASSNSSGAESSKSSDTGSSSSKDGASSNSKKLDKKNSTG